MEEVKCCVKHPESGRCLHVDGLDKAETVARELANKLGRVVFYDVVDFHFANGGTPVYPDNSELATLNLSLSPTDLMHVMGWYSRLMREGAVLQQDTDVFNKLMSQMGQRAVH